MYIERVCELAIATVDLERVDFQTMCAGSMTVKGMSPSAVSVVSVAPFDPVASVEVNSEAEVLKSDILDGNGRVERLY